MEFKPHRTSWTDDNVNNFWNYFNNHPTYDDISFSKILGRSVINLTSRNIPIRGRILDYGTSKGFLTRHLLEQQDLNVHSCDFSEETVTKNNNQFKDKPNFAGCSLIREFPSPYEDNFFDVVFLLETIEHLTKKYFDPTFVEIRRILKPGGVIVVTTPNDENLEKGEVSCPECGCIFHFMQHVNTFNTSSMRQIMGGFSFTEVFCKGIDLKEFGKNSALHKIKNKVKPKFTPGYVLPNLVYIGRK